MAILHSLDPVTDTKSAVGPRVCLELENGDRIEVIAVGDKLRIRSSGQLWVASQQFNQVTIESRA